MVIPRAGKKSANKSEQAVRMTCSQTITRGKTRRSKALFNHSQSNQLKSLPKVVQNKLFRISKKLNRKLNSKLNRNLNSLRAPKLRRVLIQFMALLVHRNAMIRTSLMRNSVFWTVLEIKYHENSRTIQILDQRPTTVSSGLKRVSVKNSMSQIHTKIPGGISILTQKEIKA